MIQASLKAALAALVAGLALTVAAVVWHGRANHQLTQDHFETLSAKVASEVSQRMQVFEFGLRGARGAVVAAGTDRIDADIFRRYADTRNLAVEFPGARGFGVIRRVPVADQPHFVAANRRAGRPDFQVHQLAPTDSERYIIDFVEPLDSNRRAPGLDIASEPHRKAAALQAMHSGQATLTRPITLVQAADKQQQSMMLLLPIYRPGLDTSTAAAREAATFGWSFTPLVFGEVMHGFDLREGQIVLSLRDVTDADAGETFFATPGFAAAGTGGLLRQEALSVYGRRWQVSVQATPLFYAGLGLVEPGLTALFGAMLSLALAALAALLVRGRQREAMARLAQAHQAAMVMASDDAIVSVSLDGRITSWNPGAERLFGLPAEAAVDSALAHLLQPWRDAAQDAHPQGDMLCNLLADLQADLLARAAAGEVVAPFDTSLRRPDGRLVEVSVSAVPLLAAARVVGVAQTYRDVSARNAAARALSQSHAQLEQLVDERTRGLETARRDLQTLLDALPSMVGYWDQTLINRFANRAYERWFDVDPAALPGCSMPDLLGDALFARNQPYVQAALRGEAQSFEYAFPRLDGEGHRHSLVHYLPDTIDGAVRGFYVLVHDVSELKEVRRQSHAAQRKCDALMAMVLQHAIVSVTDCTGRIIEANEAFSQIAGYERDELLGRSHRLVNSGVHPPGFWGNVWRTIAAGQSWRGEVCDRAKNGALYWVDTMITPLLDDAGQVESYIAVRYDITAAKLTERALRDSEAFLERTGRLAGIGGWEFDARTQQIRWSPETYRIHDVDPSCSPPLEEALQFYPPHVRPQLEQAFAKALAQGTRYDLELPFVSATGVHKWVRAVGEAELADGVVVRLLGSVQDISDRKRAEAAMHASSERFALASDAAGIGIWEYDLQAGNLIWDERMFRLFGRSRIAGGVPYTYWSENLHPDDCARVEQAMQRALAGDKPFDIDFRVCCPDGSVHHLKAVAKVHRDSSGRALRMIGVNFDITDRMRAEDAMNRTSALLQAVVDAATEVSIIAVQLDGTVSLFNSGAERLLGYTRTEVVGCKRSLDFHLRQEMQSRAQLLSDELGRPVRAGNVLVDPAVLGQPREWTYLRKDGSTICVSLAVTAMQDAAGQCFGYLGVAHDISRQKAYEQSLQDAAEAAELANLAKSQFLANMSHEIRTPLNALLGVGHLLAGTALDDDQRQLLAKSQVAGRSLLGIVNDVLDLAKIEAGELVLDAAPFHPDELLRDIEAMFRSQAEGKGLAFEVARNDDVPPCLVGDALRLRQILVNLLGNALKFTEQGGVRVQLQVMDEGVSQVRLRCSVIDTGIGISAEAQAQLFKAFAQADTSITRRYGGTGLGLSIVRELAQAMGGDAGVVSAPGQGSEFWATMTVSVPTAAQLGPIGSDGDTLEVVIVDDLLADRQALAVLSRALGWRAVELDSGAALITLIAQRAAQGLPQPDGIVIDQHMPGASGLQALAQLPALIGRDNLPATLLVTSRDHPYSADMDPDRLAEHILHKPVCASALFNGINDSVARRTGSTSKVLQSTRVDALQARWLVGVRVLVVDDSDINRDVAGRLLAREGAEVESCSNGLEALDCLRARPGAFDAVLMDVQMPVMDGLEATRRIRSELALAVPVVALTAGALVEERRRALAAGMTDFLSKPLDPQTLVQTLRRVVEEQRGVGLLVHRLAGKPDDAAHWPTVEGIDAKEAALRTAGDAALFVSLLESLLREFGGFARSALLLPADDAARAQLAARIHKLRGILGTLGARRAHRLATTAEKALVQGSADAAAALADLGKCLRALFDAAVPALVPPRRAAAPAKPPGGPAADLPPLTEAERMAFLQLLRRQDMAAMERFDTLLPRLRQQFQPSLLAEVREALDQLNFSSALALLDSEAACLLPG